MEQLALEYRKQIDNCFTNESDKEELYEWLRLYKERSLSVQELVGNFRSIIGNPTQMSVFELSKCLISHEDEEDYLNAIPLRYRSRKRSVLISVPIGERIGFSVRGGVEYGTGIFVVDVEPRSAAERCGIVAGDEILSVDAYFLKSCTHKEAVNLISKNKRMLSLKVRYVGMIPKTVLRPNSGKYVFRWKFTDDFSIKDGYDTTNMVEVKSKKEVEDKIDELFESNLRKTKQLLEKHNSVSDLTDGNSRSTAISISDPTPSGFTSQQNSCVKSTLSISTSCDSAFQTAITVESTNPSKMLDKNSQTEHDHTDNNGSMQEKTYSDASVHVLSEELFDTSLVKEVALEPNGCASKCKEKDDLHQRSSDKDNENPRQKLEAELKQRLQIERQKRLGREKALRLDRLRQELKETEREEARLQAWLARDSIQEEQHHIVGSSGCPPLENGLGEINPNELKLTTPTDLMKRNSKCFDLPHCSPITLIEGEVVENKTKFLHKYGSNYIVNQLTKNNISDLKFTCHRGLGNKEQLLIVEVEERMKREKNIQVGDHVMALDNVALQGSKTTANDITKRFLRSDNRSLELVTVPTPPPINECSEMTYF